MNKSTASLALTDGSYVSVTESETANSRHGYNTRHSAKFQQQASSASFVPDASASTSRGKRRSNAATPHIPKSALEQRSRTISRRSDPREESGPKTGMRRNYPGPSAGCNQPLCNQWERICRYVIIFFAIGSVVLICSYLGHSLSESQGSVDCVKKELKRFKTDMSGLKEEVQDMRASRESTNKKLEAIQGLLKELKVNHEKLADTKGKVDKGDSKSDTSVNEPKTPFNIAKALNKYDADKTGKTDFALESAGGSIVTVRETKNYPTGDTIKFFGVPLCPSSNGPRTMIQPGNLPGECWAFKGSQGVAVVRLLGRVRISSVSLEHIQKVMSPSGEISTAPKDFSIWGLKTVDDKPGQQLGKFTYNANGPPIQEFKMSPSAAYDLIEFQVHSNQGNPDFTCVYRLRVHGRLEGKRI